MVSFVNLIFYDKHSRLYYDKFRKVYMQKYDIIIFLESHVVCLTQIKYLSVYKERLTNVLNTDRRGLF